MNRLSLSCAALLLLLLSAACGRATVSDVFTRRTPHEEYEDALQRAGLGETALARHWLTASRTALTSPAEAKLPLTSNVEHDPSEPEAYGYRLQLERGRVLKVQLTVAGDEPALVFIDLFELAQGTAPERIASADRGSTTLEHEIERDGAYVLRIQPGLLRGGRLRIGQLTTASLTFPVSGVSSSAVRSFFRDPRDNNTREHHGIDIFAPRHTPVVAASDGFVSFVGTNRLGGNVIWIWDPERGQSHYYAHLQAQAVSMGQRVNAGEVVGYVGNTGNARTTPPHLHFGIYSRGEGPIDPLPFVRGARAQGRAE